MRRMFMLAMMWGAVGGVASQVSAQICNVKVSYKWAGNTIWLTDWDGDPSNDTFALFGVTNLTAFSMTPLGPGPQVSSTVLPNGQVQVILTNVEFKSFGGPDSAEIIIEADWKTPALSEASVAIRAEGSTVAAQPDSGFSLDFTAELDQLNIAASTSDTVLGSGSFDLDKDGNTAPVPAGPHKLIARFGFSWTHANDKIVLPNSFIVTLGPPPCAVDLNGDGVVDNGDIVAFIGLFLSQDPSVDYTGDGIIDNGDIGAFIAAFLAGCP